jgi:hypothetical protein
MWVTADDSTRETLVARHCYDRVVCSEKEESINLKAIEKGIF